MFPDLEPLSDLNSKFVQYTDSERILGDTISERIVIIEGENQSGKSSLLQMLYSSWYKKGVYPLLLHGNNIKHYNISQLLRNSYKINTKVRIILTIHTYSLIAINEY